MNIKDITVLITEIGILLGVIIPVIATVKKISNGQRCLLRSDMLRIYYHSHESGKIRQYEFENFVALYEAYKALGGNSFVDKIYAEVKELEIVS